MLVLWILLLVLFFLCIVIFLYNKSVCVKGVGSYPCWLPFVGHALFKKDIFSFMIDLGKKSLDDGGIVAFQLGWKSMYVITNVDEATTVLSKCNEKMFIYKFIEPLFGNTLVSSTGTTWKHNRRFVDLAFKQQILDSYMKVFNGNASELVHKLAQKAGEGYVDITDDITKNVLEIACQTTMGIKPDGEIFATDKFVKALHKVFEVVTLRVQRGLVFDMLFNLSSLKKELDDALEIIHEISTKMSQIRMSEHLERLANIIQYENDVSKPRSFLQIIIENSVTLQSSIFTNHDLRCLCDNVLLAAFDTTTYEMIFTLVCIGSDDEVQDKIYREIEDVLDDETTLTLAHVSKMAYLDAVVKEALRLYPIAPIVAREATTDIQLGKVTLPAGSSIAVHLWAINRHLKYWGPDAEEFRPGRWMDDERLPNHPNAFGSFSFGRRNCVGKNYAMLYMKTTLAYIIRNYRITSVGLV